MNVVRKQILLKAKTVGRKNYNEFKMWGIMYNTIMHKGKNNQWECDHIDFRTADGIKSAYVGDYVVKDVDGIHIYTGDKFKQLFEVVR